MKDILLVVDVQNDFCDGSLAVKGYREIIPRIREHILFDFGLNNTYFTFDAHPLDHCSFKSEGGVFPPHCVSGTEGGALHSVLADAIAYASGGVSTDKFRNYTAGHFLNKGIFRGTENFSVFSVRRENGEEGAADCSSSLDFIEAVKERRFRLFIAGLATDYCIKATALDAAGILGGGNVFVYSDAVAGIDPEGSEKAFAEMAGAGIVIK